MRIGDTPKIENARGLGPAPRADELVEAFIQARGARPGDPVRTNFIATAGRSLERALDEGKVARDGVFLSLHAEEAGKVHDLLSAFGGATAEQTTRTKALMNRVVDAFETELKALAAGPSRAGAADAIERSEEVANSLKSALSRLRRHGFAPRAIDVDALVFNVKRAAVDSFR